MRQRDPFVLPERKQSLHLVVDRVQDYGRVLPLNAGSYRQDRVNNGVTMKTKLVIVGLMVIGMVGCSATHQNTSALALESR